MGHLLAAVPPLADVVDPFMGIGTTLRVAKNMGFSAIGVELEESYCEIAAKRMCQEVFDFGGAA
jgi:site-specific DNA-methyltransferase (adenine-specific)